MTLVINVRLLLTIKLSLVDNTPCSVPACMHIHVAILAMDIQGAGGGCTYVSLQYFQVVLATDLIDA